MFATLAFVLIGLAAVAAAAASVVFFLRARAREEEAPEAVGGDGLAEMRAIGQRIETLVGQQQLQGETARQQLAQQIDAVGQSVEPLRHHVAGLQNELRHEVRRRDAEMDEIRHQLASIQHATALGPATGDDMDAPPLSLPPAPDAPAPPADATDDERDAPETRAPEPRAPESPAPAFHVPTFGATAEDAFPAAPTGDGLAASFGDAPVGDGWDTGEAEADAPAAPPAPAATSVFSDPFASGDPFGDPFAVSPTPPAAEPPPGRSGRG